MTTATRPAEAGFLREIIANPQADADRLIFADWLEENGQPERASFIRVQCELAGSRLSLCSSLSDGVVHPLHPYCPGCRRVEALRRRERELLDAHGEEWMLATFPNVGDRMGCLLLNNLTSAAIRERLGCPFRRGFVAEVRLTLADWCGAECGRCAGDGQAHGSDRPFEWSGPGSYPGPCPICYGRGCTPGHGPALVRAAPLEIVCLTDKRPGEYGHGDGLRKRYWRWFDGSRRGENFPSGMGPDELPGMLWRVYADQNECWEHPTERHALDALSAAALAWAKAQPAPPSG